MASLTRPLPDMPDNSNCPVHVRLATLPGQGRTFPDRFPPFRGEPSVSGCRPVARHALVMVPMPGNPFGEVFAERASPPSPCEIWRARA